MAFLFEAAFTFQSLFKELAVLCLYSFRRVCFKATSYKCSVSFSFLLLPLLIASVVIISFLLVAFLT